MNLPSRPLPPGIPSDLRAARAQFEVATKGLTCKDILHSRIVGCPEAFTDMAYACFFGSIQFLTPFFLVYLLWNLRKAASMDEEFYWEFIYCYIRSILFGTAMGSIFTATSCTVVRLSGGFKYWTCLLIPGWFAGLSTFIDHPYRRKLVLNAWCNMTLEYLYRSNITHKSALKETTIFMLINSLLLYLLRTAESRSSIFWFYIPRKVSRRVSRTNGIYHEMESIRRRPSKISNCPLHQNGSCWKSAMMESAKYFLAAAALHAVRVIFKGGFSVVSRPTGFFSNFFSMKTLAGSSSIGGYVLLFKAVLCAVSRLRGFDCSLNTIPAGFIAGAAYRLQPNTTILTSSIIAVVTLLYERLPPRLKIPQSLHAPELLFALCNGILFHARCMDMGHCPTFIKHMMDTVTCNRSRTIFNIYLRLISQSPAA